MLTDSYVWWHVARVLLSRSLLVAKVFKVAARVLIGSCVWRLITSVLLCMSLLVAKVF